MTVDRNNNIIEIGDIVKITESPNKSDNATYIVAQDGTSEFYNGLGLALYKVAKHKNGYTLSRTSYNICFYPLVCYSNKYKYTREELDTATIEILIKNDHSKVEIIKNDDKYEHCNEDHEKNLYFHCGINIVDGKQIEDVSYLCSQVEKLQAFLSNITLKADEEIKIIKACNSDLYYTRTSYKAVYKDIQEQPETIAEDVETVIAQNETMEFEANYTAVNENTAKTAKEINSHDDYKQGTATQRQKYYTDAIVKYANELLKKHPTDNTEKIEKVQYYIDNYSKKVASAIDRINSIDASCPSMLVCGAGNFPTRKKAKQNAARNNYYQDTQTLYNTDSRNYYFNKIRLILIDRGIIRSDDKNAVQMIKDKIAMLEAEADPYGNKKAEIRRLKGRLLQLAPEETKQGIEISINRKEATFENIVDIFNESIPKMSKFSDDEERYYLNLSLVFSNGKRKYNEYLSNEVNADCTMLSTYGNRDNGYKTIWKPLTDELKFMLIINKISGSGNKAVMYSILKDLLKKEPAPEEETTKETQENELFKVVKNEQIMRLQLLFDGKPSEKIRDILKSNGFRWSPKNTAWQRLLNDNALYSLKRVTEAIEKIA